MPSTAVKLSCLVALLLGAVLPLTPQVPSASERFPYTFANFPWWTDSELRTELKRRIPMLSDQIARNSPGEDGIRTALVAILKTKGIDANIQVHEPDLDYAQQKRVPEAPPVAIVFSIASPPFFAIDKIELDGAPPEASEAIKKAVQAKEGTPYSTQLSWSTEDLIQEELHSAGYLTAKATLESGAPVKDGNDFKVPLLAHIAAGPLYRVGTIQASGGPLLANRDLSSYYNLKPGDIAVPNPFGRLAEAIRSTYWHAGYPDVEIHGEPILDPAHSLASYSLTVTPGALYHLRSIEILHLNDPQKSTVLSLLGLQTGDIFDGMATNTLYRSIAAPSSPLAGFKFTYTAKEDKTAQLVDLTLDFFHPQ